MVKNEGTVWKFTALSDEARNFTDTSLGLEPWQVLCHNAQQIAFAIDHRPAHDLVGALVDEGFVVRNNLLEDAGRD